MADIRKERERREREDQYDPERGWAPRINRIERPAAGISPAQIQRRQP